MQRRLSIPFVPFLLLFIAGTAWAQETVPANDAIAPVPRDGGWMQRHESMSSRVKQGNVDLVFIGDSITQGWEGRGKEVWQKFYGKRNAVNLGIGGDRTQHVIWRLDNGNLDGITPKAAVIMIGTNNSGSNSPEQIAQGVTRIVEQIREKSPSTKVLLLATFPRGADPSDPRRQVNESSNAIVSELADGQHVFYLDIGKNFLGDGGTLSKEIMPDLLHLSEKGYTIWAESIEPHLARLLGEPVPQGKWKPVTIDTIQIGYGLQIADVNGDAKPDIVLADKNTIQWYENPTWEKHIIARDLTERDNVCVTARDIDGDGKCEIAVGGQWNFSESVKDGAVFYLIPPEDRTQMWTPVELYHDPSTHRMHWIRTRDNQYRLVVKPLRGRGTVNGEGPGLRVLEYIPPKDPASEWDYQVVCDFLHMSHNFHPVNWDDDPEEEMIIAAQEGVWYLDRTDDGWASRQLTDQFAGEIRDGRLPGGRRFLATVEPMHGSIAAAYVQPNQPDQPWQLCKVLSESLKDGHALACADFLGVGSDQVVVGWRAMNTPGTPGITLFTPLDETGTQWRETPLSTDEVAVEDIKVGDLNGDGKVDIIAAARQTKNLVIFFNES